MLKVRNYTCVPSTEMPNPGGEHGILGFFTWMNKIGECFLNMATLV